MVSSRRPRNKRTRGGVRDEGIAPARGTGTSKVLAVVALVSLAVFLQSRSVSDAIIGSRQYPPAPGLPGVSANASLPWRDRAQLRLLEARKPGSRAPLPPAGAGAAGETAAPPTGKLVFVKTYKTGSTTVASLLNAAGYQRGMSMLHPEKDGWFTEGEIVNRTAQGQMFDLGCVVATAPAPLLTRAAYLYPPQVPPPHAARGLRGPRGHRARGPVCDHPA